MSPTPEASPYPRASGITSRYCNMQVAYRKANIGNRSLAVRSFVPSRLTLITSQQSNMATPAQHTGKPNIITRTLHSLFFLVLLLNGHSHGLRRNITLHTEEHRKRDPTFLHLMFYYHSDIHLTKRHIALCTADRPVGLMVRRPAEDPGFESACAGIFSGSSHTSD